jgi:hypothetical protein
MPTSVGMTLGVAPVGQTFRYLVSLVLDRVAASPKPA